MRAAHRDLPVTEGDPLSSTIDAGDLTAAARSREALLWAGAIAVALGLLVVLFSDAIAWLTLRWQEPEYSHGWFIPIVSLFLLWQRRRHILASRSAGSWWGVVLVTIGIALLSLRALVLMHLLPAVGFAVTLMGLGVAALGGASMRYAWMPLAFLLFALPPPAGVQVMLSTELQLISSQLGAQLLDWFGVSVFLDGNVIDLGVYKLQVAEACSGLRYLFPLASFAFLAACFFRAPVWARAAVFLSVVPITVVMNSVRIAATGLLIQYGSIESAEGLLHIFEGWVVFVAALALLFAVMALLGKLNRPSTRLSDLLDFERMGAGAPPAAPAPPGVPRPGHPGPPFVACLGLLLATPLALGWLGDRPEAIPRRPGLLTFPLQLDQWQGRILPVDPDVLGVLDADDYLLADFGAPGVDTPVNLWVAYYDSQVDLTQTIIHSPQACLPGTGWEFVSLATTQVMPGGDAGEPFEVNQAVIAKGDERMVMLFWYEQRGRRLSNEFWTKFYVLVDSFTMRRSDGALLRLMTRIAPGETVPEATGRLSGFLRVAHPRLAPHVGM